jgi:hypothetical protein
MASRIEIGCQMVGEFVDEGEGAALGTPFGHVEGTQVVGSFVDDGLSFDDRKDFTVLLKDHRIVTVRGNRLKYLPNPANPSDCGNYGILVRAPEGEFLIALFRAGEVTGIFNGGIAVDGSQFQG